MLDFFTKLPLRSEGAQRDTSESTQNIRNIVFSGSFLDFLFPSFPRISRILMYFVFLVFVSIPLKKHGAENLSLIYSFSRRMVKVPNPPEGPNRRVQSTRTSLVLLLLMHRRESQARPPPSR